MTRLLAELILLPFAAFGVMAFAAALWDAWYWRSWQWMASYHRWDRRWSWYVAPGTVPPHRWQWVLGWVEYTIRWPVQRLTRPQR